jgi:hypothetical protein
MNEILKYPVSGDGEASRRRICDRLQWLQLQQSKTRSEPVPPWHVWLKQRLKATLLRVPIFRGWIIRFYLTYRGMLQRMSRRGG